MKFLVSDCGGPENYTERSASIQYTYDGIIETEEDDKLAFDVSEVKKETTGD